MAAGVVVIIGPPAAGKGTQADRLAVSWDAIHLSSGALLRAAANPQVAAEMQAGEFVATPTVEQAVRPALAAADLSRRLILDGFIRLPEDSAWLERLLADEGREIRWVVLLQIDQAESVRRGLLRGRADDTPEALAERWREYQSHTVPVIEHYRQMGRLVEIDGMGTPDEVTTRLEAALANAH